MKKYYFKWLYKENTNFKKFKKGDRLRNDIFIEITKDEKSIYIVSTKLKKYKYTYKISFSSDFRSCDLDKFINVLKYNDTTWTVSNISPLKNSEHLSLKQALSKHSLNFTFKIILIKTPVNILNLVIEKKAETKKQKEKFKMPIINQELNYQIINQKLNQQINFFD